MESPQGVHCFWSGLGVFQNHALRGFCEDSIAEGPREVISLEDGPFNDAGIFREEGTGNMPPSRDAVPEQSGYKTGERRNEEGMNKATNLVLLDRFEVSTPTVDFPCSLSVFGQPLFQGGSSSLGG